MPFFFPTGTVDLSNCLCFNSLSLFPVPVVHFSFPFVTVSFVNLLTVI